MSCARIAAPLAGRCGVALLAFALLAFSLLAFGGCASEGTYEVRWSFGDPALAPFQPGDCGKHGVSAIAIAGRSDGGSVDNPVAACAPGVFTHKLPPGSWTLDLTALDAAGLPKTTDPAYLRGSITIVVSQDQLAGTGQGPVVLLPLPACQDGVDNDCDGRVDLDDPGCTDAAGVTEQGTDLMLDPQPERRPGAPTACTP